MPVATSTLRRIVRRCAGGLSIAVLAGCSKTVDKNDVAEQVSTQLAAQVGTTPDSVSCPRPESRGRRHHDVHPHR